MVLDLICSKKVRNDVRPKFAYYRGDFDKLRDMVGIINWEESYNMELHLQYEFFSGTLNRLITDCEPTTEEETSTIFN